MIQLIDAWNFVAKYLELKKLGIPEYLNDLCAGIGKILIEHPKKVFNESLMYFTHFYQSDLIDFVINQISQWQILNTKGFSQQFSYSNSVNDLEARQAAIYTF